MADVTNLVQCIGGLKLGDGATELPGTASQRPADPHEALSRATRTLIESARATIPHAVDAEQLISPETGPENQQGQEIAQLSALRREANALANHAQTLNDASEQYIVDYIVSLASPSSQTKDLLSHFRGDIEQIVQDVLNHTSDDTSALQEILETCYSQALQSTGSLHYDKYIIPLEETSLGWPYDPDFESEVYYNHQNRLDQDTLYAEKFGKQCAGELEDKRRQRESWIGFWVNALGKCPNGPTLFYPPASLRPRCDLIEVPRYLFRVFDQGSSGKSDSSVVASMESVSTAPRRSQVDILSRPEQDAVEMLYGHLDNSCFHGENSDNLMSWSSSLLFLIQYAIWRCYRRRCDPDEVKICMVDTTDFPQGQFARDKSLLRAYSDSKLTYNMRKLYSLRFGGRGYDNGEYLSQGYLHHAGRSSVTYLAQLIQAGLHEMYPEFADQSKKSYWTNRVKELREKWSFYQTTTPREIRTAIEIAKACFPQFDELEVAMLLLSFKNRKREVFEKDPQVPLAIPSEFGPAEVQRYMEVTGGGNSISKQLSLTSRLLSLQMRSLAEALECS